MNALRHHIAVANSKLHEDREAQTQMDKEIEAFNLEDEIQALEDEQERLSCALASAHEQSMNWDKKIKYAKELKDSIKKEQQSSGSALKLATHHMRVRYQELYRVQEKLMHDLELEFNNT